ncbi:MAG: hypothetical protein PHY80_01860 [Rickettsiales bacterium]|nr:hypothetical protein [Rickettsiales bacterium]
MQNILYFNTIFQGVSIILQQNSGLMIEKKIENEKQSEILVSSIEQILTDNGLKYNNIDIFTSIVGPGNFTGIKTSLAVLKALQISTKAKIITCNIFDIISFELNHDLIILDMGTVKLYIEENNEFYTIYKKDLENFLKEKENKKIITNNKIIVGDNIIYSDFTNQKWINIVNYKVKNNLWTEYIEALYIEEAGITKRKN